MADLTPHDIKTFADAIHSFTDAVSDYRYMNNDGSVLDVSDIERRAAQIEEAKLQSEQAALNERQRLKDEWVKVEKERIQQERAYNKQLHENVQVQKERLKLEQELIEYEHKFAKARNEAKYEKAGMWGKAAAKIENRQQGNNLGYSSKAKAQAAQVVVKAVFDALDKIMAGITAAFDIDIAVKHSNLKETQNAFDKEQKLFQAHMEMSNVVASNIVTSITSMASQTATDAARAMASGAKEEANARIKLVTSQAMAEREFEVAESERLVEKEKAIAAGAAGIAKSIGGIVSLFGPWGAAIGMVIQGLASLAEGAVNIDTKLKEFDIEKQKAENEMYQQLMQNVMAVTDKMKNIVDGIDNTANAIADKMRANETIYKQAGLAFGFSGDTYSAYMRKVQDQAAKTFNITAEQIKQMNDGFMNASGRTRIFSGDDYDNMTAASRTFGVSQGEIATAVGEMDIFNMSVDHFAGKDGILDKMYDRLNKMGLSTSKFVKDLTNNLKLAQKYNFKGGAENMAKLTMWAEKTRFNLQNATNFADKMMSNNISDVLETSAKLQVLGGNAGIYADPMAMMWEAGNDVGVLAKRQAAMFADITGSFNSKTGETTFTETDLRMIKARAEAMGMNYEDVLNQKRQSNKQGVINKALAKYNLDDDTLNGIGQRANYDTASGKFMVDTLNGKMSIDDVAKLSEEDRKKILMPENENQAILETATNTRSLVEMEEALLSFLQNSVGIDIWDKVVEASNISMKSQEAQLTNQSFGEAMGEAIISQAKLAEQQQKQTTQFIENNTKAINDYRSFVAQNVAKESVFQEAELGILAALAETGGVEHVSDVMSKFAKVLTSEDKEQAMKDFRNSASYNDERIIGYMTGSVHDAIGSTNGGYLSGASVTPINDGVGTLVKTHPNDQFIAAKAGGPIDKLFDVVSSIIANNNGNSNNNIKLDLSGSINLNGAGGNVDIVSTLKNDPIAMRDLIRLLIKSMDAAEHGKVSKNHYV